MNLHQRRWEKATKMIKGQRKMNVLIGRRNTVYKMLSKRHNGVVPCFVCGNHVDKRYATAEHIIPKSKGGTNDISNIGISHSKCNRRRGNTEDSDPKPERRIDYVEPEFQGGESLG